MYIGFFDRTNGFKARVNPNICHVLQCRAHHLRVLVGAYVDVARSNDDFILCRVKDLHTPVFAIGGLQGCLIQFRLSCLGILARPQPVRSAPDLGHSVIKRSIARYAIGLFRYLDRLIVWVIFHVQYDILFLSKKNTVVSNEYGFNTRLTSTSYSFVLWTEIMSSTYDTGILAHEMNGLHSPPL